MSDEDSGTHASGGRYGQNERVTKQVSMLLGMLGSSYQEARTSAIVQLSRIGEPAVPQLIRALSASSSSLSKDSIIETLGMIVSPTAAAMLSKLVDEAPDVLGLLDPDRVAEALATAESFRAVLAEALLTALDSGEMPERATAARKLGEVRERRAIPGLVNVLQGPYDQEAWHASLDALVSIGDASALPSVLAAWRNLPVERESRQRFGEPTWLAAEFAGAVAKLGGAAVVPDLLAAILAADYRMKESMKASIVSIGEPAIPALAEALQKGDSGTQKLAAEVIAAIKVGRGAAGR